MHRGGSRSVRLRFSDDSNASFELEVEWNMQAESWRWTSAGGRGFVRDMDPAKRDIIIRLCTEAGSRMEDASVIALTISRLTNAEMETALNQLAEVAEQIVALVKGADALQE